MKILYLCHRIPYPPNKGDKIRSFNEIKHLSEKHCINLFFLIDNVEDLQHVEQLRQYAATIDYAVINPRWQKVRSAPYLLTAMPLSVPYFYSSEMQEMIDKRLDSSDVDAVFCFSSPMAEYVFKSRHYGTPKLQKARLLMDFVDVDSDKWRMYAGFSSFPHSWVYQREWRRLQKYDAVVGSRFNRSIFASETEVDLFRSFCPVSKTAAIANGVDLEYFAPEACHKSDGAAAKTPIILFMGAMDYYPNEDAVVYFATEVMPVVQKAVPEAQFYIVGSNPSKPVSALANIDGVKVTGTVADVRPYLSNADVFVAPIRIARGIQNKVLEAMAAGVPVVARPEAVQGFGKQNLPMAVETSTEDFAAAVIHLLLDRARRDAIASEALHFVRSGYRWDSHMDVLQRLVNNLD